MAPYYTPAIMMIDAVGDSAYVTGSSKDIVATRPRRRGAVLPQRADQQPQAHQGKRRGQEERKDPRPRRGDRPEAQAPRLGQREQSEGQENGAGAEVAAPHYLPSPSFLATVR